VVTQPERQRSQHHHILANQGLSGISHQPVAGGFSANSFGARGLEKLVGRSLKNGEAVFGKENSVKKRQRTKRVTKRVMNNSSFSCMTV
jgi:hypothetical protein